MRIDKNVEPRDILPRQHHSFLDVFDRKVAEKLTPHRAQDHVIILKLGAEPPHCKFDPMGQDEVQACKDYQKNLDKGFIQLSQSPAATPVLFVKKPDGSLQFCVDYGG